MADLKYSEAQAYDPNRAVKDTDIFSLLDPTGTINDPDPTKRKMQACTAAQLKTYMGGAASYTASIYAGTKGIQTGSEHLATGVTGVNISNVTGTVGDTITLTVDGTPLTPVFTVGDVETSWSVLPDSTTISWVATGTISAFDLGQGKFN